MFYFKDKPVSISKLDVGELDKIKAFQESLGSKGVYYWTYKQVGDFSRFVRLHLGLAMQEYGSTWGQEIVTKREPIVAFAIEEQTPPMVGDGSSAKIVISKPEKSVEEAIKTKKPIEPVKLPLKKNIEENEEGYLDLLISSVDKFNSGTVALKRIAIILQENAKITKTRTEEINQLPKPVNPNKLKFIL